MNKHLEDNINRFLASSVQMDWIIEGQIVIPGGMQVVVRDQLGTKQMVNFYDSGKVYVQGKKNRTQDAIEEWLISSGTISSLIPQQAAHPITHSLDISSSLQVVEELCWQFAEEIRLPKNIDPTVLNVYEVVRGEENVIIKRTKRKLVVQGKEGRLLGEINEVIRQVIEETTDFEGASPNRQKDISVTRPAFHGDATHFRYCETKTAWEGPTKFAFDALNKATGTRVLSPGEYLDYIKIHYPQFYENFEWLTFYRYPVYPPALSTRKGERVSFDMRIVVSHTQPAPHVRSALFEFREKITAATGWYPLVSGSKAWMGDAPYYRTLDRNENDEIKIILGRLIRICDAGELGLGNSLLIEGSAGSLLLDAGFDGPPKPITNLQAVFLSHFHYDHSGGIANVLSRQPVPVILSEASLSFLWYGEDTIYPVKKQIVNSAHLIELTAGHIRSDCTIHFFPVFHAPGSYGISIRDTEGHVVYYLGDACLRNGFMDSSRSLLEQITAGDVEKPVKSYVVLDAAMIGKVGFVPSKEGTPVHVLESILKNNFHRNIVFVSDSPESLIYSFLLAFYQTRGVRDVQVNLALNNEIYKLARSTLRPALSQKHVFTDPYVTHLIGGRAINFIESHRVYPLSALPLFREDEHICIFTTLEEVGSNAVLRKRIAESDVAILGPLALHGDIPGEIASCKPNHVMQIDSPEWSFHSDADDLASFIKTLNARGMHVILSHNSQENIAHFIKEKGLNHNLVCSSSKDGVNLKDIANLGNVLRLFKE